MDYLTVILLVAVAVSGGQAGIIKRNNGVQGEMCARSCLGTRKFNYEVGSSYEYDYSAVTTTKMNGASHDGASLSFDATVIFEPVTKCDMIMTVKNVRLSGMENSKEGQQFSNALMLQPLRFSFQDGKVEEICPMSEDPTWVLNIKRGILSAFQNSMDDLEKDVNVIETDVVGSCLTEYKVGNVFENTKIIQKSKDLLTCTDREYYNFAMHSVQYNIHSKVQSLPLLKSYHGCSYILDWSNNILRQVKCTEENIFRPFSNGKSGAMTRQTQMLTFRQKSSANSRETEMYSYKTNLLFDHKEKMSTDQYSMPVIMTVFEELCDKMSEDIRPELPKMLNDLIDLLKNVDYMTLRRIYRDITRKDFCQKNAERTKKYFHDILPMLGSTASVKMFQYLTSIKEFDKGDTVLFLGVLSLNQNPSKEMVEAVTPLLDNKNISHDIMLPLSSIVASYCQRNPKCDEDYEIDVLISKYLAFVGNCDTKAYPHTVKALRSLGNIGYSSKAVSALSKCVTTTKNPIGIRVSAIDAFRRIPCDASRSALMEVFDDPNEDSEIRINAYLGLMKCPSRLLLKQIHRMLGRETSNQVGSFIWTHLRNLEQTSDPHLQNIQEILQSEELVKQFNLDKRKFSRNYEGSFFSKNMNAGAKLDSNIIFSPKSFIPRSANLNLTLDLFGHAINILEVGGRFEDHERDLERSWTSHRMTNAESYYTRPKSHMYMRVFGNEFFYGNMQQPPYFFRWFDFLVQFKSMQLVNTQVKYPTLAGFPLKMGVKATGAINSNDQTKWKQNGLDLAIKFSAVIEVTGDMTVDAHVTKTGLKMVSMAHTSTGVEFVADSKVLHVKFPKEVIEYANLKTDFYTVMGETEKKHKLITDNVHKTKICTDKSVEHLLGLKFCQQIRYSNASQQKDAPFFPFTGPASYSYYMENVDVPQGYQLTKRDWYPNHTISFETPGSKLPRKFLVTDTRQGLRMYAETPWRNMKFEVHITTETFQNITSKAKLSLDNRFLYKFDYYWLISDYTRGFGWKTNLRVTGPEHSGELMSSLEYRSRDHLYMTAKAVSSEFKPISVSVKLRNDKKSADATAMFKNGPEEYTLSLNISKEVKNNALHFKPKLKMTALNRVVMEFDSQLVSGNGRVLLIFKLYKLRMKPFVISKPVLLNIGMGPSRNRKQNAIEGRIGYKSGLGNARIVFKLGRVSRVVLLYNFGEKYNDYIVISTKGQIDRRKNIVSYIYNFDVNSKKKPVLNFNFKGRTVKAVGKISSTFVTVYTNPSAREKQRNTFKLNSLLTYSSVGVFRKYSYILTAIDQSKNINFQVKSDHVHSHTLPIKKIENNVMFQISPKYVIKTGVFFSNVITKGQRNSDMKLSVDYPGRKMEFREELNQISSNTYKNKIYVQWATGYMMALKTTLKNNPKVVFVENILALPNQHEAKLTTAVNIAHQDYGVIAELHVDKEIISTKEDIDWKAASSVKYRFKKDDVFMESKFSLDWAPEKKIRAIVLFDDLSKGKFTMKISMVTPFKIIQSFDDVVNFEGTSEKYTLIGTTLWKKYDKMKTIKETIRINHKDSEYYYNYKQDYDNKVTEIQSSLKFNEDQKSASLLLKHNDKISINTQVTHSKVRQQMSLDSSFVFDIFDKSGKFTAAVQKDHRETTLSGDFEHKSLNYFNELVQVGGSYKLMHNKDVSSVLLQFTNNDSEESKISVKLNKDLPRNLKAKVHIVRRDTQLLKMDADYTRRNDNFDVNVDITDLNSKKMTALANVNLSGQRKTSHAEIRTDSMDIAVDGAVEYDAGRYFDGEFRLGSGGKDLLISGNYKLHSPSHKISVNFGLPNSKHIKAIAIFKDGPQKTLSLNVDSPDFASLAKIQTDISFLSNSNGITINSSVAVMPHLESSRFSMHLPNTLLYGGRPSPNENFNLNLALKSSPRLNSVFSFEYDPISKVKSELSVADFKGKLLVSPDKLLLKGKFQNAVDLSISYLGQPSEINASLKLKTPLVKGHIEIEPKKNNYAVDLTLMHDGEMMTVGGSYKVAGQKQIVKANLKSSSFEDDLTMTISGKLKKFKVTAKLQHNHDTYELVAANKAFYKSLDINLYFPGGEAKLDFEGELQRFKAFTSVTVDNEEYKFVLSNQDYLKGILAEVTTPQFGNVEFSFDFNAEKPRLKASISFSNQYYGIDVYSDTNKFITEVDLHFDRVNKNLQFKIVMSYINADDRVTFFRQMSTKLTDKYGTYTANLHLKATARLYSIKGEYSWGDYDDQKISAELQLSDQKEILLIVSTPRLTRKVRVALESNQNRHSVTFTITPDVRNKDAMFQIMSVLEKTYNGMTLDTTINIPNQKEDWRIKTIYSGLSQNSLFRVNTDFSFGEDRRKTINFELTSYFVKGNNTLEFTVKHPYSNTALKLAAFTSESPGVNLVGTRMTYNSKRYPHKEYLMLAKVDRRQREIKLRFEKPDLEMEYTGRLIVQQDSIGVEVNKEGDGIKEVILSATAKKEDNDLSMKLQYNAVEPSRKVGIDVNLQDQKFMLQIYRIKNYWYRGNDVTLTLEKRPFAVLFFNFLWNPSAITDFKKYIKSHLIMFRQEVKDRTEIAVEKINEELVAVVDVLAEDFKPYIEYIDSDISLIKSQMYDYINKFTESTYYKNGRIYARHAWKAFWELYDIGVEEFEKRMEYWQRVMYRWTLKAQSKFDSYVEVMNEFYSAVEKQMIDVGEMIAKEYDHLIGFISSIQEDINSEIREFITVVNNFVRQVSRSLDDSFYKMSHVFSSDDQSTVYRLLKFPKDTFNELLWALEYWRPSKTLMSFNNMMFDYLKDELNYIKDALTQPGISYADFNPTKGALTALIDYRSLVLLNEISEYSSEAIRSMILIGKNGLGYSSEWGIIDIYYDIKPSSDVNNWLPPFNAQATIFKNQHVTTFDGHHYRFQGSCTYTLANVKKNFKLDAKFSEDKNSITHITITISKNEVFTIYSTGRVTASDKDDIELPFNKYNSKIYLEGDTYIYENIRGYNIRYNPKIELIILEISGWFYSRVNGLFGSYNNEQHDDIVSKDMIYRSSLEDFVNSWSTEPGCYSKEVIVNQAIKHNYDCSQIFLDSSSPFRNCFKQVAPVPFYHMCSLEVDEWSPLSTLCEVSMYYIAHCSYKNVPLTVPKLCYGGSG